MTRALAFYLPQFHPTLENDSWWGAGFTEWTNAARAKPLFRGHVQPHLPADLGFYDLRLPEAREAQADLAAQYGLSGFVYWHYWFGDGRRMLERPFNEVLESGRPDFGFCLGWANQTWTGTWHGAPDRILVEQRYPGLNDEQRHFDYLLDAFRDPRYVCVDERPLFYIFRPEQIPDVRAWTSRWQTMAKAAGLPGLYLVAEVGDLLGHGPDFADPTTVGFDAGVYVRIPADSSRRGAFRARALRKLGSPERYNYEREPLRLDPPAGLGTKIYPCVYPNWDNTPRSGRHGLVLEKGSAELFRRHVRHAIGRLDGWSSSQQLLLIKSWNEWAEGNYLEPDLATGSAHLRVLAEELGAA